LRTSFRIALCAALFASASARAEPRGGDGFESAFSSPDAILVAEREGRGSRWSRRDPIRVPREIERMPREIERAARQALERLAVEPSDDWPEREPQRSTRRRPAPGDEVPSEPTGALTEAELEAPVAPEPLRVPEPEPAAAEPPPAVTPPPPGDPFPSRGALATALLALLALAALPLALRRRPRREDAAATRVRVAPAPVAAVAEAALAAADAVPAGGRYEIQAELGRGGMGVVYRARDTRLDRVVALKRLPDQLRKEPRFVEMLLREARSAARLNHRNIVTVYDVDHEDGAWFITMELLEGSSLAAIVRERGRLTPRSAVWLAEQALAGLGYAHERGVVHRDVKPGNLFVTRDRTLKLMDFGLARIVEEARRKRTLIGGTPDYMAPEQATGEPVDGRADLYALGATLFELLTGAVPFAEGDALHHHRHTPPPDPRASGVEMPDALADLILALLAKAPAERPPSAADVVARLRAIAATLPKRAPGG
jgi:tRNA A-37 threonylcarbamoyl transferase component Bud32